VVYNIRGTSGTGKTTLVREIMARYEERKPIFIEGRKRPIGYVLTRPRHSFVTRPLFIVGSYESVCGGCDTITVRTDVYKVARQYHAAEHDVIFEGLLCSDECNHTMQFHIDGIPITVVALNTPIEVCLERVNARRRAKKPNAEPVNPKNTIAKARTMAKVMERFKAAGMRTYWFDNPGALDFMVKDLGLAVPE